MRPPATTEEFLAPAQVKVGDLFEFSGVFHPVWDMRAVHGGRLLLFQGRQPYAMTQPEILFRPLEPNHSPIGGWTA